MNVAYVDTSALVSIVFGEPGATRTVRRLEAFDELFSSNLLEAELLASLAREEVSFEPDLLSWISWVLPARPLTPEYGRALAAGYLRGADLWHIACAIYLAGDPSAISFVTLDKRQKTVAGKLGFDTRVRR
jgi:predicted nucleic acid-binding protein